MNLFNFYSRSIISHIMFNLDTPKSDAAAGRMPESIWTPSPNDYIKWLESIKNDPDKLKKLEKFGREALHTLAEENYADGVNDLLNMDKSSLNGQNNRGETALIIATRYGNIGVVTRLLDWNANIDLLDNVKRTALHWAAENGNVDIMEKLLSARDSASRTTDVTNEDLPGNPMPAKIPTPNIDLMDLDFRTPLNLALGMGRLAAVKLLLERGADNRLLDKELRDWKEGDGIGTWRYWDRRDAMKTLKDWDKEHGGELRGQVSDYFAIPGPIISPPQGPLDLGMFITNLKTMKPCLKNGEYIRPPSGKEQFSGFRGTRKQIKEGRCGPWAASLEKRFKTRSHPREEDIFEVGILEDRFFSPTDEYIRGAIKAMGISPSRLRPLFMVTGMKIARQVSFTPSSTTKTKSKVLNITGGANADTESKYEESKGPSITGEVILAVRLMKLSYKNSRISCAQFNCDGSQLQTLPPGMDMMLGFSLAVLRIAGETLGGIN
ncbi:ankyrin repeat-containing domain protein [Camillea tinctor]|nr:ankyrin repeat-containing domain protein [Camillea tinctor]